AACVPLARLYLVTRLDPFPHLHSFPTRRSSDLAKATRGACAPGSGKGAAEHLDCQGAAGSESKRRAAKAPGTGAHRTGERQDHRSEEHTSELQSRFDIVCRLLLEKKKSAISVRSLSSTSVSNCSFSSSSSMTVL